MPKKLIPINGTRSVMAARTSSCCPTCGRPNASDDLELALTPLQRRILALLKRHGEIHAEILYSALYASDPNGGPDPKTLDVTICEMNQRLQSWGLAIQRRVRGRPGQPWRLVQIAEAAE